MKFQKWLLGLNSDHLEIANLSSILKKYSDEIVSHVKKCSNLFKLYVLKYSHLEVNSTFIQNGWRMGIF